MNHTLEFPSSIRFVMVEGLDASGKESFVAELERRLSKKHNVRVIHFPRYEEEPIGPLIRSELQKAPEARESEKLRDLFQEDRRLAFQQLQREFTNQDSDSSDQIWVLLDRCHYSNYIYGILQGDHDVYLKYQLMEESEFLPKIHHMILLTRMNLESTKIHQRLLEAKTGKDQNETEEIQATLASRILSTVKFLPDLLDIPEEHIHMIPIGSYFTDNPEQRFDDAFMESLIESLQ